MSDTPDDRYFLNHHNPHHNNHQQHHYLHHHNNQQNQHVVEGLDCEELANACRRLGISGPLEPLLRELKRESSVTASVSPHSNGPQPHHGGSNNSKERRHTCANKTDRKSNRTKTSESNADDTQRISKSSTYGQESWGRDSGARDLSPEQNRVAANCQMTDTDTGTSSMIHLANKLQVAALSALKTEVLELSARLQNAERERETVQRKLSEAIEEKDRSQRRLDSVSATHESRITEMHCIIVELSKKLKARDENAIIEEHEHEGSVSELSFQEGSVYNSEMECANVEQESQTEPLDTKLIQPIHDRSESPCSLPPPTTSTQIQLQAMQEEVLHLRSQVALLQSQLACDRDKYDQELNKTSQLDIDQTATSQKDRSNYTSDDLCETAEIFEIPSHDESNRPTHRLKKNNKNILPLPRTASPVIYGSINSLNKPQNSLSMDMVSPKMLDKIKLRRNNVDDHRTNTTEFVSNNSGCGVTNGLFSAQIANHLVSNFLKKEGCGINSDENDDDDVNPDESPPPLNQPFQSEIRRLQQRIDHIRIQNTVLTLTLAESKSHCNHLYLLCGKYESNAIALHQALSFSDRAIEAYDVMLALLESRLGIVEGTSGATESQKAAEAVARHLLQRLECDEDLHGNSLGPWQDAVVIYANNSSNCIPWTTEDDTKLRNHVSKLKGQRASLQNTVVTLESPFYDESEKLSTLTDAKKLDNRRTDLETAVLMQELMSIREESSELKYRAEQAEREKNSTLQHLGCMQEAMLHLKAQLADSEALLALNNKDRSSYSEAEHTASIERELVEALARESRLKARLQGLASSLEAAAKSSEEKYAQVQNTVADLKQTNLSLTHSLDRCKRKYQTRLKRLEKQVMELSLKNDQQYSIKE